MAKDSEKSVHVALALFTGNKKNEEASDSSERRTIVTCFKTSTRRHEFSRRNLQV